MPSYLLEIGSEEIPAGYIMPAYKYLESEWSKRLSALSLSYSNISVGGSPCRLYINIEGLPLHQEEKVEVVMGPPANIAFDDKGNLTDVAKKFALSKNINESTLKKVTIDKGDYLQGEKKVGGEKVEDLLLAITPDIIKNIPFAKSMKWGDGDFRFARPIMWILSLFNDAPLVFEVAGIKASNFTFGHKFLCHEKLEVKDIEDYRKKLETAYVYVDFQKRREIISSQIKEIAEKENAFIEIDEDLLDTVSNLVEYPKAILGSFDELFLNLPEEVLITSMKTHQKYFPIRDKNNKLVNKFIGISNMKSPKGDDIIRLGYERVLKARLNDALFFYNNDKKVKLSQRVEGLKKVVYHEKLGTSYEKMERFKEIALFLADKLHPNKKENIEKTAYLSKADLLSEMVFEFPELQGIMGYYYGKNEGLDENISCGIKEHYMPRFAGDDLPETCEGKIVSIADKIDTISSVFAMGAKPTGNLDPFALRRCAIGIISIIEKAGYRIDLKDIIEITLKNLENKLKFNKDEVLRDIISFINLRYRQILTSKNIVASDVFDSVCDKSSDILKTSNLAKVISDIKDSDDFQIITQAFKRINNILKKNNWEKEEFSDELLETAEEKALGSLIRNEKISKLISHEENKEAVVELMKFAPIINNFFENVMVMAEDMALRENRLGLIATLRKIFLTICDLDKIGG